jgi:glycosyltransferase involved in cell wall biosynthesis
MKQRIVIISSHPDSGGSEKLWQDFARYADKSNIEILICVNIHFKDFLENELPNSKITYWDFHKVSSSNLLKRTISFIKRYTAYYQSYISIRNFKPNSILINEGNALEFIDHLPFLSKLITRKFNYFPLAHMINKIKLNNKNKHFIHNYYSKAKKALFVSNRSCLEVSQNINFNISNLKIVRNTVGLKNYGIVKYKSMHKQINFAIVGSLDNRKNQKTIIKVLSQSKWLNRDWQLNIYGEGESESEIKTLIKDLGMSDKIHLKGYENEIENIWKNNLLNILPSFNESAPISIVEAMICGRPTVATDVGGVSEWIDEQTGFLAKSPTPHDLEEALELAWQQKNKWEEMGRNAHDKALNMMGEPEKDLLNILINQSE